jgi:hypothetical protein
MLKVAEPLARDIAAYARTIARRRALSIATSAVYFDLRNRLFAALAAGRITVGELSTLNDQKLLEKIGIRIATGAPSASGETSGSEKGALDG